MSVKEHKVKTGNLFEQPPKLTNYELRQRQSWIERDNQIAAEQSHYDSRTIVSIRT